MVVGGRAGDTGDGRQTFFFLAPLLTPFVILGVPMLDTLLAITRRTMKGSSFAIADRRHLHHRLLELGHGPRRVVVILWSCSALLSGFVLAPLFVDSAWMYVPIGFGVVATAIVALRPRTGIDQRAEQPNRGAICRSSVSRLACAPVHERFA